MSGRRAASRLNGPVTAVCSQCTQALGSFVILAVAARTLGLDDLGKLSVLYGVLVLCAAATSGFVGDSMVVLDRLAPRIRAGLEVWLLILGGAAAVVVALVCYLTGFVTAPAALVLAIAVAVYLTEDLVRRLLAAHLQFGRVILTDLFVLAVAFAVIAVATATGPVTLSTYLAAIAAGQAVGIVVGWRLVPQEDRYLSSVRNPDLKAVADYGLWRSAQHMLKPALLTAMRITILLVVTLAAAGALEIARIYTAPAMLVVNGVSTFLFASFAKDKQVGLPELLQKADRSLLALLAVTVAGGTAALVALPVAGPLVTGQTPDLLAVAGWLASAVCAAAVTPYGALAAVRGRSRTVFFIRLAETTVSLSAVVLVLQMTGQYSLAPWAAAGGSILGAAVLRFLLLERLRRAAMTESTATTEPSERQPKTYV